MDSRPDYEANLEVQPKLSKLCLSLTDELLRTQNIVEEYDLKLKDLVKQNATLKQILECFIENLPADLTRNTADVLLDLQSFGPTQCSVTLRKILLCKKYVEEVTFSIDIQSGTAGLVFSCLTEHRKLFAADHVRSFDNSPIYQPEAGPITLDRNEAIGSLGTTDWCVYRQIIDRLCLYFGSGGMTFAQNDHLRRNYQRALETTKKALDNWPLQIRYDYVNIFSIDIGTKSKKLGIALRNISLGDHTWEAADYILGTEDDHTGHFGAEPYLQFLTPETDIPNRLKDSSDVFTNRGTRITFKPPSSVILGGLENASELDRLLVIAIASSIKMQLSRCRQTSTTISNGEIKWEAWMLLASRIKFMLNRNKELLSSAGIAKQNV